MHILLDARTATPHFPGIGRYVGELALALADLLQHTDDRLTVVIPPDCTFRLPEGDRTHATVCNRTPFDPRQQAALRDIAAKLKPDLYHSPYYLMPVLDDVPTVLTMHDCIPLMQPGESSLQARTLFRACAARALKACTTAIAVSETTRTDSLRFFPEAAAKFTTIPHGVHGRFTPRGEEECAAVVEKHDLLRPFLLFLGSNRPHKNVATLLTGYAHAKPLLKGHRLVIAGYGSEATKHDRSLLKQGDIAHDVSWIGPVPEEDLPALFSAASAFACPSFYEGFGLPMLEAMATGTPVACSETPCLRELGGEAVTYFDPKDADSLAHALVACIANESSRKRQIAAGLARAANYRWSKVATATLGVYRATVGHG
jgi:alpha-1,3-rhamnosyl/mannosyltransferase